MTRSGAVIWLTGLPATGKTTVARGLTEQLRDQDVPFLWLDSDDLRSVLTPNASYSPEERDAFYEAIGHIAQRAAEGGVTVVISATASRRAYRDAVRARVHRFIEVLLECSASTLRARDPKGLYARADAGEIKNFPGVQETFEINPKPELRFDTESESTAQIVEAIAQSLGSAGVVS